MKKSILLVVLVFAVVLIPVLVSHSNGSDRVALVPTPQPAPQPVSQPIPQPNPENGSDHELECVMDAARYAAQNSSGTESDYWRGYQRGIEDWKNNAYSSLNLTNLGSSSTSLRSSSEGYRDGYLWRFTLSSLRK